MSLFTKNNKGRTYHDSIYKDCVMVSAKDLAVGDTLRHGGHIEQVQIFSSTNKVMYFLKGGSANIEVTLDVFIHLKKD